MFDDARRVANGSRPGGHRFDHDSVGADACMITHREAAQYLGASADNDALAQGGVTLGTLVEARATECDTLIDGAVITNFGCFSDHYAKSVVDEHPSADLGAWMNLNAGEHPTQMRNEARKPVPVALPKAMGQAVNHDRMQARVAGEDLQPAARSWITLQDTVDIFAKFSQHGSMVSHWQGRAPHYPCLSEDGGLRLAVWIMAVQTPRHMSTSSLDMSLR